MWTPGKMNFPPRSRGNSMQTAHKIIHCNFREIPCSHMSDTSSICVDTNNVALMRDLQINSKVLVRESQTLSLLGLLCHVTLTTHNGNTCRNVKVLKIPKTCLPRICENDSWEICVRLYQVM